MASEDEIAALERRVKEEIADLSDADVTAILDGRNGVVAQSIWRAAEKLAEPLQGREALTWLFATGIEAAKRKQKTSVS